MAEPTRYVDAAYVTAYQQAHGGVVDAWAGSSPDVQEGATQTASEWLDREYRERWKGARTNPAAQVRDWPRAGVVDAQGNPVPSDVAPAAVKDATAIASVLSVQGTLPTSRSTPEIEALLYDYITSSTTPEAISAAGMLALVEQAIARMLAGGGVQSMAYNGRSLTFATLDSLFAYRAQLRQEQALATRGAMRAGYRRGSW